MLHLIATVCETLDLEVQKYLVAVRHYNTAATL